MTLSALLLACVVNSIGVGGDDSGVGTDDSGTTTGSGCKAQDVVWTSDVTNALGTEPFYSGDTLTLWGLATNPCSTGIAFSIDSSCLFEEASLVLPYDGGTMQVSFAGCTPDAGQVLLKPNETVLQSATLDPLYTEGTYTFTLFATDVARTPVPGTFTIL